MEYQGAGDHAGAKESCVKVWNKPGVSVVLSLVVMLGGDGVHEEELGADDAHGAHADADRADD